MALSAAYICFNDPREGRASGVGLGDAVEPRANGVLVDDVAADRVDVVCEGCGDGDGDGVVDAVVARDACAFYAAESGEDVLEGGWDGALERGSIEFDFTSDDVRK